MPRTFASSVVCCALLFLIASSSASAQVIYTPVQYQYFAGGRAYYYGGSNPLVHERARQLSRVVGYGRTEGYAFQSGDIDRHREVSTERPRIYSDAVHSQEAGQFGFTATDAANEAYANAPRYFRKADIVDMARVQPDGSWVVPAHTTPATGSIEIRAKGVIYRAPAVTEPQPILIIPKRLLDKKLWPSPADNQTADAR